MNNFYIYRKYIQQILYIGHFLSCCNNISKYVHTYNYTPNLKMTAELKKRHINRNEHKSLKGHNIYDDNKDDSSTPIKSILKICSIIITMSLTYYFIKDFF